MKSLRKTRLMAFFILIFTLCSSISVYAIDKKENHTPETYAKDEFTSWQKDLRRFEIISFGAMPFVSLLSFWSYDIYRSIKHKGDPAYKPWPVKDTRIAEPLSEKEQKKIFASIVGISVGVAVIDLSYRLIKRELDKKKRKEIKIKEAIELIPLDDALFDEKTGSIKEKNLFIPINDGATEKTPPKKRKITNEKNNNS